MVSTTAQKLSLTLCYCSVAGKFEYQKKYDVNVCKQETSLFCQKAGGNLIYLESVNDSSKNFSSLVSSGCKNVSNSSFANSFSSSDGMCHWMFRLKRSPGFPQSYTWRLKYTLIFSTITKLGIETRHLRACGCFSVTNNVIAKWLEDWFQSYETRNDLKQLQPEIAKLARNLHETIASFNRQHCILWNTFVTFSLEEKCKTFSLCD